MGQPEGKTLTVEQVAYIKALHDTLGRIPQVTGIDDMTARHVIGIMASTPHRGDLVKAYGTITQAAQNAICEHLKWTQSLQVMKALAMVSVKPEGEKPDYPTVADLISQLLIFPLDMRVMTPGFDEYGLLDINISGISADYIVERYDADWIATHIQHHPEATVKPEANAVIISH